MMGWEVTTSRVGSGHVVMLQRSTWGGMPIFYRMRCSCGRESVPTDQRRNARVVMARHLEATQEGRQG